MCPYDRQAIHAATDKLESCKKTIANNQAILENPDSDQKVTHSTENTFYRTHSTENTFYNQAILETPDSDQKVSYRH
jgi:HD-like signal output (HDOD) protein